MSQQISPLAGKPAQKAILVDVSKLLAAYAELQPDPGVTAQRVAFGASGHRGTSFERSFNEWHILAITQAICDHRLRKVPVVRCILESTPTPCRSQPSKARWRCSAQTGYKR